MSLLTPNFSLNRKPEISFEGLNILVVRYKRTVTQCLRRARPSETKKLNLLRRRIATIDSELRYFGLRSFISHEDLSRLDQRLKEVENDLQHAQEVSAEDVTTSTSNVQLRLKFELAQKDLEELCELKLICSYIAEIRDYTRDTLWQRFGEYGLMVLNRAVDEGVLDQNYQVIEVSFFWSFRVRLSQKIIAAKLKVFDLANQQHKVLAADILAHRKPPKL